MDCKDLKSIVHPASESPGKKTIYLFFLDPRGDEPIMMTKTRFLSPNVTPSTCVWVEDGYQRLPLFWIYKDDFLRAIEYSKWASNFEERAVRDAVFSFPDYMKMKANKEGKKVI